MLLRLAGRRLAGAAGPAAALLLPPQALAAAVCARGGPAGPSGASPSWAGGPLLPSQPRRGLIVEAPGGDAATALRTLDAKMRAEGILQEAKDRKYFEKPSMATRMYHKLAQRRAEKAALRRMLDIVTSRRQRELVAEAAEEAAIKAASKVAPPAATAAAKGNVKVNAGDKKAGPGGGRAGGVRGGAPRAKAPEPYRGGPGRFAPMSASNTNPRREI